MTKIDFFVVNNIIMSETLNDYLIPDLSDMVLEYCWPIKNENMYSGDAWTYGCYEKACGTDFSLLKDACGTFILCIAAEAGYMKLVKLLLDKGVEDKVGGGLVGACRGGYAQIVELLLEQKSKTSLSLTYWLEGLEVACGEGYEKIVKLMLVHYNKELKPAKLKKMNYNLFCDAIEAANLSGHNNIIDIIGETVFSWQKNI